MEKFLLNFKKIFIKLQLVFLRTKLNFKAKKLGNLVMSFVVVFGILIIVGGKFVGVGNAAQETTLGSNIAQLSKTDFSGCLTEAQNSPIRKWIKDVDTFFSEKRMTYFGGILNPINTFSNIITRPCKYLVVVPKEELNEYYTVQQAILYLPNYNEMKVANGNYIFNTSDGTGILDYGSNVIASIYQNKPVSGVYSIDQTIASVSPLDQVNADPVPTYASNPTGVQILSVIMKLWQVVRDIALTFYVIVFFVIAFSIMFRRKLSGQTYVNVINSIPGIIISLILVVFSYQIGAAIVDLGNLVTNIVQSYAFSVVKLNVPKIYNAAGNPVSFTIKYAPGKTAVLDPTWDGLSIQEIYNLKTPSATQDFKDFVNYISANNLNILNVFGAGNVGDNLDTYLSSSSGGGQVNLTSLNVSNKSTVMGGVISLLNGIIDTQAQAAKLNANAYKLNSNSSPGGFISFILAIIAVFTLFKIFFALLKQYVVMIFYPALSPIFFLFSALPGQGKYVTKWIKTMTAAVFTFCAFYAVAILIVFLGNGFLANAATVSWFPAGLGITGASDVGFIFNLAAFGLFMMMPSIPKTIESVVGAASDLDKFTSPVINQTRSIARRIPGVNLIPGI